MDRSDREEQFMEETLLGSSFTFPYIKHCNVCLPSFAAAPSYDVRKFYFGGQTRIMLPTLTPSFHVP